MGLSILASTSHAETQQVADKWMNELTLWDVVWKDDAPSYQKWLLDNYSTPAEAGEWRVNKLKAAYKFNKENYPGTNIIFYGEDAGHILNLQDEYPELIPIFEVEGYPPNKDGTIGMIPCEYGNWGLLFPNSEPIGICGWGINYKSPSHKVIIMAETWFTNPTHSEGGIDYVVTNNEAIQAEIDDEGNVTTWDDAISSVGWWLIN